MENDPESSMSQSLEKHINPFKHDNRNVLGLSCSVVIIFLVTEDTFLPQSAYDLHVCGNTELWSQLYQWIKIRETKPEYTHFSATLSCHENKIQHVNFFYNVSNVLYESLVPKKLNPHTAPDEFLIWLIGIYPWRSEWPWMQNIEQSWP